MTSSGYSALKGAQNAAPRAVGDSVFIPGEHHHLPFLCVHYRADPDATGSVIR